MKKTRTQKQNAITVGVIFAIITLVGDGFQTIVNNSRPAELNSLLFSWITACTELMFIFPFFLISFRNRFHRKETKKSKKKKKTIRRFKKYQIYLRLIVCGVIFAGCAYYLIVGFTLVDSVTGILAVKTQPISMMLIGALFLKEKLSVKEVLLGIVMLVLIIYVTTKGTFNIGELSLGVVYLLVVPVFWNVGHSLAKPLLSNNVMSVPEFVFVRISFTSVILGIVFLIVGNIDSLALLNNSHALASIFGMGCLFAILHTCWYQAVRNLPLSIASLIVIPSPVVTAILTYFITKEPLFYYHWVGIVGEIGGLSALIFIQKCKKKKE